MQRAMDCILTGLRGLMSDAAPSASSMPDSEYSQFLLLLRLPTEVPGKSALVRTTAAGFYLSGATVPVSTSSGPNLILRSRKQRDNELGLLVKMNVVALDQSTFSLRSVLESQNPSTRSRCACYCCTTDINIRRTILDKSRVTSPVGFER